MSSESKINIQKKKIDLKMNKVHFRETQKVNGDFMKKSLITLTFLTMIIALVGNGISLNSIGPKAGAMGGAFVGQADDATAVFWNPAGLVGQKASFTASMVDVTLFPTYKNDAYLIDAEADDVRFISPHIFANYAKDKFAWGFGFYVPHALGVEWEGKDFLALNGPQTYEAAPGLVLNNNSYGKEFDWKSQISMITVSSSAAYQVTDRFNVGISVNIHHGSMELKRGENRVNNFTGAMEADSQGMLDTQYSEEVSGSGTSFSFGLQYSPVETFTVGISYRSPSLVAFSGDAEFTRMPYVTEDGVLIETSHELYVKRDFEIPFWLGVGTSWKANEKWTFNLDGQLTRWSTYDKLISEIVMEEGTENVITHMEWEDAIQVRFGTEFQATKCLALRAGYFYDPAPAPDETVNILFPSSTNHNATIGGGYTWNNFTLDLAAEYYFGEEREIEAAAHNMPGTHQMDIFAYMVGLTYTF